METRYHMTLVRDDGSDWPIHREYTRGWMTAAEVAAERTALYETNATGRIVLRWWDENGDSGNSSERLTPAVQAEPQRYTMRHSYQRIIGQRRRLLATTRVNVDAAGSVAYFRLYRAGYYAGALITGLRPVG